MSMIYAQWRFPSIAKSTMSHPEMGFIVLRNGQYQNAELIISDYVMGYIRMWYYTKCPLSCRF